MSTETRLLLIICCILISLPIALKACPPDCGDCKYWDGDSCEWSCSSSYCCGGACRSCCDNSQCGSCETCSSYTCSSTCSSGEQCCSGTCQECCDSGDCDEGEYCESGICYELPPYPEWPEECSGYCCDDYCIDPEECEYEESPTGGDPVYITNGEFKTKTTDLVVEGRKLKLDIKRYYRSKNQHDSTIGYGWELNFNQKIIRTDDPDIIIFFDGKGNRIRYTIDPLDSNIFVRQSKSKGYFKYNDNSDTFSLIKNAKCYMFNSDDNLVSIEDDYGNIIKLKYDDKRVSEIIDDIGRKTIIDYNNNGKIETITDSTGRVWKYIYDHNNNLVQVNKPGIEEYPQGKTTYYSYDDKHNLISVAEAERLLVINDYDSNDRVVMQHIGDATYEFEYYPANNKTTITNPEGIKKDLYYNNYGLLTQSVIHSNDKSLSFVTKYEYDPFTRLRTRVVFPAGNCIDYTYNEYGMISGIYKKTKPSDPNNPEDPNVIAPLFTYNNNHKIRTITDPVGNKYEFGYDNINGSLKQFYYPVISAINGYEIPVIRYEHNKYGQITKTISVDDIIQEWQYYNDKNEMYSYGRLKNVIDDADPSIGFNLTTEYTYDNHGNINSVIDPGNNVERYIYNEIGLLIKTISSSPIENIKNYNYDNSGNLIEIVQENGGEEIRTLKSRYDSFNRLIEKVDPYGYITNYRYDKEGNIIDITDAEHNSTKAEYNERGLPYKFIDAKGNITQLSYDKNGNIEEIIDTKGNVSKFKYDGFDRLIQTIYPDGTNEMLTYDKNSNILREKRRDNSIIQYEYNSMNRVVTKKRKDEPEVILRYDKAGRLIEVNDKRSVENGGGTTSFSYDRIGRLISVKDPDNNNVRYKYDRLNRRTEIVYPSLSSDIKVNYKYNSDGKLKQIILGDDQILAEYKYDDFSRRQYLRYSNDTVAIYSYNKEDRLKDLINVFNGSQITYKHNKYDKVGNLLSMTVNDKDVYEYQYDNLYRLVNVTDSNKKKFSFHYDESGNRTNISDGNKTTNYEVNNLNQYNLVGNTIVLHDKNGNLKYDGINQYEYDCENRIISASNKIEQYKYSYDYIGRRIRKHSIGGGNIKYCYDTKRSQVLMEYEDDNLIRYYVYGPTIDEPVCMILIKDQNPSIYFYHYDGRHNVVAISDSNGKIVEQYSYDPYGKPNIISTIGNSYLFAGRRYDKENGLYYNRARYYSPSLGRFLQPDPLKYLADLNLYTYVNNNSINQTDPYGAYPWGEVFNLTNCATYCLIQGGAEQFIPSAGSTITKEILDGISQKIASCITTVETLRQTSACLKLCEYNWANYGSNYTSPEVDPDWDPWADSEPPVGGISLMFSLLFVLVFIVLLFIKVFLIRKKIIAMFI